MILLAFGISELGRAIHQYNTLTKATRDAARYLTLFETGTRDAAAICLAVYGTVVVNAAGGATCSGTPLLPGLSTANVAVAYRRCPRTRKRAWAR